MKRVGARGYGLDLRERIVMAVREKISVKEVAQQYRVHSNPTELLFSKLKALLRGSEKTMVQTLYDGIGRALEAVTSENIFGWFRHAHPSVSRWRAMTRSSLRAERVAPSHLFL
ncbi:hypothetical protein [Deinococcus sp.]|uniref:hypothetical protein n=1 Tax=Deinococcus sp. TaxID=47478 RepID=UPI003C7D160F